MMAFLDNERRSSCRRLPQSEPSWPRSSALIVKIVRETTKEDADDPSYLYSNQSDESSSCPSFMSPTLPIRVFRPHPDMEIAFDTRTRTPIYVMERLQGISTATTNNKHTKKNRRRFRQEVSLPVEFRSQHSHYKGSGYDRGHLIPAANFPDKTHHSLANTVPQVPSMNRHGWAQLEAWVRQVADREWNQRRHTTYVITGPLWLPTMQDATNPKVFHYSYQGLGTPPSLLLVPTHLFKVVVVVSQQDDDGVAIVKFAAFCMPNCEMSSDPVDLARYLVRLSDLQAVTGLCFFPNHQHPTLLRERVDTVTENVWMMKSDERRQP